MTGSVRPAQVADIPSVVELRLALLSGINKYLDAEALEILRRECTSYLNEHLNKDCLAYVYETDERITASAILTIENRLPTRRWPNGKAASMHSVYTLPEYRHLGQGRALCTALLEEAKRREVSCVMLDATADGMPLYESLGFVPHESDCMSAMELQLREALAPPANKKNCTGC